MPFVTGAHDGIVQCAFGVGACQEGIADAAQRVSVADVVARLVVLEAGGELFGVVEDFLGGSGHGGHLRYFARAGMAWTMIGPSALSMTPTFEQVAGGVGADEHREVVVEVVDDNRVVEGLDHVVVADAVLPSARRDQRRIHDLEVNLRCDE